MILGVLWHFLYSKQLIYLDFYLFIYFLTTGLVCKNMGVETLKKGIRVAIWGPGIVIFPDLGGVIGFWLVFSRSIVETRG